jgi:hypothetical protein
MTIDTEANIFKGVSTVALNLRKCARGATGAHSGSGFPSMGRGSTRSKKDERLSFH